VHDFDEDLVVERCLDGPGGNGWIVALRYLWADTAAGCGIERDCMQGME